MGTVLKAWLSCVSSKVKGKNDQDELKGTMRHTVQGMVLLRVYSSRPEIPGSMVYAKKLAKICIPAKTETRTLALRLHGARGHGSIRKTGSLDTRRCL